MSIANHFERINHEIPRINLNLLDYAYRVDGGNGLKDVCKLSKLKSVDYFEVDKNGRLALLEFSDLSRQYDNLLSDHSKVDGLAHGKDNVQKKICKDLCRDQFDLIKSEFLSKYNNSIHVLRLAVSLFKDAPDSFKIKPVALLVTAPPNEDVDSYRHDEIYRKIDRLSNQLRMTLPEELFEDFVWLDIYSYAAPDQ